MTTRTNGRRLRRALPGVEQLEARTVLSVKPSVASAEPVDLFPVEPLAPLKGPRGEGHEVPAVIGEPSPASAKPAPASDAARPDGGA